MLKALIKKHESKIRFVLVGGTNTVIDFGFLFIFTNIFGLAIIVSNIFSTSIALIFSFFANKKFTFKDSSNNKSQPILFLLVTLFGLWIIQPLIITAFTSIFRSTIPDKNTLLFAAKLLATCASLIWNYILYSKLVFKTK